MSLRAYEQMHAISAAMAEAARAQRWDRLAELEAGVARLRDALAAASPVALGPQERDAKARLIRGILENDAEVRRHTEPWMEHVCAFLAAGARGRDLRRAYGAALPGDPGLAG